MSDTKPVIFISYSHKDEPAKPKYGQVQWRTFVQSYLQPAMANGEVHLFVDEDIRPGVDWRAKTQAVLARCHLLVLLVSVHSLASEEVLKYEVDVIRKRQRKGEKVHILPIVLEPFPKKAVPWLMKLNLVPKDDKSLLELPLTQRKKAMAAIADKAVDMLADARKRVSQKVKQAKKIRDRATARTAARIADIGHLPETAYVRLVGRERELARLDKAWTSNRANVLSLIAEGGAGKSALVNEWLKSMKAANYRGAEKVLGWSFYSQGTKERATSAEQFLDWAVKALELDVTSTSATAKGEAIADVLLQRRLLLVLDGVEPLQHGPDGHAGQLKDLGLAALLRRFAGTLSTDPHGLIVLTSRLPIMDISRREKTTSPIVDLGRLSSEAGTELLRDNGVWGTDKELASAVRNFGGHPLALGLLATYLKATQDGDIRRRDHIRAYLADPQNPRHDHAKRVMESYEREWLAGQPVLLAIMRMVGLFDRPASEDCLKALRVKPAIAGLTDEIVNLEAAQWKRAIGRLREVRLLAPMDPIAPGALDAHPLVREWFGARLKETNETAWRSAHGRIYEHLRDKIKEGNTPTLEQLVPLYQAIAHGCRAGRHPEALNEIYVDRICRRHSDGSIAFYSQNLLGARASNLAAMTWFFDKAYVEPSSALDEFDKGWVLNEAAVGLVSAGRLHEALSARRASRSMCERSDDSENAAISGVHVCEAELTFGEIARAIKSAEEAVRRSDRSADKLWAVIVRTVLARALRDAGQTERAKRLLAEAEDLQRTSQIESLLLHGMQGYIVCDLLLSWEDPIVARDYSAKCLELALKEGSLGPRGLFSLALGRAQLAATLLNGGQSGQFAELSAATCLDLAVDWMRATGALDRLPQSLLARAALGCFAGDWLRTTRDLDEVEEMAELGPMRLHLCDLALARARLAFAKVEAFTPLRGMIDDSPPKPKVPSATARKRLHTEAAAQIAIAAALISECGYHRRDAELAELQSVLRGECTFASLPIHV